MTGDSELPFWVAGRPHSTEQTKLPLGAVLHGVRPTTMKTFKLAHGQGPLRRGRRHRARPCVVVIDEALAARTFWPDERSDRQARFASDLHQRRGYEVVGVVGDVRALTASQRDSPRRSARRSYIPSRQTPDAIMPAVQRTASGWSCASAVGAGAMTERSARGLRRQPRHADLRQSDDGGRSSATRCRRRGSRGCCWRLSRSLALTARRRRHLRRHVAARAADARTRSACAWRWAPRRGQCSRWSSGTR